MGRTAMPVQELPTKAFLEHLRRHLMPEIIDDECFAALSSVEAQYGDVITHGAGLEVRLGEEARYADYIMNIDEASVPGVKSLWHEIDYAEFRKAAKTGGKIAPCLFANVEFAPEDRAAWDAFLPPFLGEARAKNLRAALDRVMEKLPDGAHIKQVGTMTSRGEIDIMRLVILFPSWDVIPGGLAAIGWQGDVAALRDALAPWREIQSIAVNIDLGEKGVLPKIGVEVFSRWRHPLLVDKFLARLEDAGLCLKSKGDALRRWIRIRPDGDPFIQVLISYFKLNYKGGKIVEAKAYLEQSPYIHHHYFDAYERPARLDMELTDGASALPVGDALAQIWKGAENRVRRLRFYGGEQYEHLDRLLAACEESGVDAEIVLAAGVGRERLVQMSGGVPASFLVEIKKPTQEDAGMKTLSFLRDLNFSLVRAKWNMNAENAAELAAVAECAEALGAAELVVAGMCAGEREENFPIREDMERAAKYMGSYESPTGMTLVVDSCFSPLRAYLGGEDPKRNANRGITRGCEAGRSFCAVRANGEFSPCLRLAEAGETGTLVEYWEQSPELRSLREAKGSAACDGCPYGRRCLPCPAIGERGAGCPLAGRQ